MSKRDLLDDLIDLQQDRARSTAFVLALAGVMSRPENMQARDALRVALKSPETARPATESDDEEDGPCGLCVETIGYDPEIPCPDSHRTEARQDDDEGPKMTDIPWHDRTIRRVPVGAVVEVKDVDVKRLRYADVGGTQTYADHLGDGSPFPWGVRTATRVFTEARAAREHIAATNCEGCDVAEADAAEQRAEVERLTEERDFQTERADGLGIEVLRLTKRHGKLQDEVQRLTRLVRKGHADKERLTHERDKALDQRNEVAAKALRDAAQDCEDHAIEITLGGPDYVAECLRVRADRIEAGASDE